MAERIIGCGSALPKRCVDNHQLAQIVDTSDEWIQSRTGIESRHIAEDETTVSLAVAAARRAIEDAEISALEIDQIIVATTSSEQLFPGVACMVQAAVGAEHAGCFDLNAACTGFIAAFQAAAAQIRSGIAHTVLVIGAEVMSHLVDWSDRSTCILFGDGAGAVILQDDPDANQMPSCFSLHSDGASGQALTCRLRLGMEGRSDADIPDQAGDHTIHMDGRAVYQFAVRKVPEVIGELLEKAELSADMVDCYILHQANRRIIESIARHLKQPIEKFPMNLMRNGNISAASIPVLLDELKRAGRLKRGMRLMLAGFGAGLSWGGILMQW